jgi:hypothetical protein
MEQRHSKDQGMLSVWIDIAKWQGVITACRKSKHASLFLCLSLGFFVSA